MKYCFPLPMHKINPTMEQTKATILLAEDEPNLSSLLEEYLQLKGYQVKLAPNGEEALDLYQKHEIDLCLLDIMMPKMDGFTLARKIREKDEQVPIIFLTAKSLKDDKIEGFNLGADDYITKPFSMEELLARIEAVLRRTRPRITAESEIFQFASFTFDANKQILKRGKEETRLTTKESQLLRMLCKFQNRVLERDIALNRIWGNDSYFTARSMDVFITKLRKYLKEDPRVQIINIHGTGYKLTVDENS